MTEKKKKKGKVRVKIEVEDIDGDELSEEELEEVAGGILNSPALKQDIQRGIKSSIANVGPGAAASGYCDCWSYTAGMMNPAEKISR